MPDVNRAALRDAARRLRELRYAIAQEQPAAVADRLQRAENALPEALAHWRAMASPDTVMVLLDAVERADREKRDG